MPCFGHGRCAGFCEPSARKRHRWSKLTLDTGIAPWEESDIALITLSRQAESLGDEIGRLLSERLGCRLITREFALERWLSEIADAHEIHVLRESAKVYLEPSKSGVPFGDYIAQRLHDLAARESLVVLGLGAQALFHSDPAAVHVRVIASEKARARRAAKRYGLDSDRARELVRRIDRKRRRYLMTLFEEDWDDPSLYHICINSDAVDPEAAVDLIIHLVDLHKASPTPPPPLRESLPSEEKRKEIPFGHPSEEEFARILDLYKIKWQYEPTTFPLEWDAEGNVTNAFTPDFYLPEFDTYIELTTMKQAHVTRKNRKVRLLKQLHPDVNIRIIYNKDYHALIERFGFTRKG